MKSNKGENFDMMIYEELKARGLIAQVTNEEEIRDLVNHGKATFYIGDVYKRQPVQCSKNNLPEHLAHRESSLWDGHRICRRCRTVSRRLMAAAARQT